MKKQLSLLLFLLLSLGSFAQLQLSVSGMVALDFPQGPPVPGQMVVVQLGADSVSTSTIVTYTNEAGIYALTIENNIPEGFVLISTYACGDSIVYTHPFGPNNTTITQDFVICQNGGGGDCQAMFDYQLLEGYAVAFNNFSSGNDLSFDWQFGDGSGSNEPNPVHTYAQQGVYDVCLTIASADSSCSDILCLPVMVGGDVPPACLAMFGFVETGNLTVDFINLSEGGEFLSIWDFGDGQASTETNPSHTYATTGMYEVTLTIIDSLIGCTSTSSALIMLGDSSSCIADFSYIIDPNLPLQVVFTEQATGSATLFMWDFGDNSVAYDPNPVHTYSQQGVYNVCLTVMSNDSTCYDVICQPVVVGNEQPGCQAMFTYFPVPENDSLYPNPLTMQFWDTSIGNPTSWSWDFGDGSVSSEQFPVYTFGGPGVYNVCLTIQSGDQNNCTSTYCEPVVISADTAGCIAQFVYYPASNTNELTYEFLDLSYGNGINSWMWDFGDGTASNEQNPVHVFTETGTYQVCLTIAGNDCQSSWCEQVMVGDNASCYNYFTYQEAGNSVLFNGYHSTDIPAAYLWEFGDGSMADGQQVSHTYENPGIYYVNLFTSDDNQCSAVSSQMIVVGDSIIYQQLYGQVFEGNLPVTQGLVLLFSVDTIGNYMPFFDVALTDSSGIYVFPYVPQGNFLLYAISMNFDGYMPTYYGDVLNWEEATVISLGEPANPYNINLVATAAAMAWGNNSINGTISNNAVRDGFMDKIKVLLYNEANESLGFTEVNADGTFSFANLAQGIYFIYPELSGVSAQRMRIDLTGENATAQVNMTFNGNSITGINKPEMLFEAGTLYPNPVRDELRIPLKPKAETQITWQIVGVDGRLQAGNNSPLRSSDNELRIDVSQLPKGLYILQLTDANQQHSYHKFIK